MSLFVHLIESVVAIVRLVGENAVAVIETVLVTVDAGCDAPVIGEREHGDGGENGGAHVNPLVCGDLLTGSNARADEKFCGLTRTLTRERARAA